MSLYKLKLYVTDRNTRASAFYLIKLLEEVLPSQYELEVISIEQHPEIAEKHNITATPTLIRCAPLPIKRIIGQFTDAEQLINNLTLDGS